MAVKEATSSLVFLVIDSENLKLKQTHAQRMDPSMARKRYGQPSKKFHKQAFHYNATYHLVDTILGVRNQKGGCQLKIRWMVLEGNEDTTWEPLYNIRDELPGILESVLHTPSNQNLKNEKIDI